MSFSLWRWFPSSLCSRNNMTNYSLANWVLFFPIAVTVFIAMRITGGGAVRSEHALFRNTIELLIKLSIVIAIVGICCRASMVGTLWIFLVLGSLVVIAIKNREMMRSAFLLTLFHCAHQSNHVQTIARSFVDENQGWLKRRCLRLLRTLSLTSDWGQAVEVAGLVRGTRHKLAIRMLSRYGNPGLVRHQMVHGDAADNFVETLIGRLCLMLVSLKCLVIVMMIETFIIPTFVKLFQEFSAELPFMLRWFNSYYSEISALAIVVPLFALCAMGVLCLLYAFPNALTFGPQRWLLLSYFRALTFEALGETCKAGTNLVDAIRQVASVHPVDWESRGLMRAAKRIEAGMNPGAAFRAAWVAGRREAAMLDSSLNRQDLSKIFAQLGTQRFDRCMIWYAWIAQIGVVLFVFALAIVVGSLAYAVISALSEMIKFTV